MQTERQRQAQRGLSSLQRIVRRQAIKQHEAEQIAALSALSDQELVERLQVMRRQRRLIRRVLKARQGGA
jgi:hypothetical protein